MNAKKWNLIILSTILTLSLTLGIVRIGQEGLGNHYYTAAARNMMSTPSNFFFGSFDTIGFVTVDKPPVALWIQSLFIKILGLNTYSIMLPSIIAATLSVLLLYLIVRKSFGEAAGLSSAFILTITPVFTALSRNNTMDALLIAFLLFAAWLFQKGLESKKLRFFLFSAIVLGVAFNIKMMQAFVILPALLPVYFMYYRPGPAKKIIHTLLIVLVLLSIAFSWGLAVKLTPEDKRPYIGGSKSNSALELMLHYNGLDRAREFKDPYSHHRHNFFFETGEPGILRLFNPLIGGQAGWFIPFAVLGTLLFIISSLKEKSATTAQKRDLLFWGIWFVILFSYLSFNSGFFHTHYIGMITPALAALGGIAVTGCMRVLKSKTVLKWGLPGVLIASTGIQILLAKAFPDWNRPFIWIISAITAVSSGIILFFLITKKAKKYHAAVMSAGLLALTVIPFSWSLTPILYGGDFVIPYARPDLKEMKMGEKYFRVNYRQDKAEYKSLLSYLDKNRQGEKYLLGVESALTHGANLMLLTDGDIMTIGGFDGSDPILTPEKIASLTEEGTVRFFLVTTSGASTNEAVEWVMSHGKIVLNKEWKKDGDLVGSMLYDCRP